MSTSHLQNANMLLYPTKFILNQHSDIKTNSSFSSFEEKKETLLSMKKEIILKETVLIMIWFINFTVMNFKNIH